MQEQGQSLIRKHQLTDTELTEIEHLMDICNTYEDLHMRFSWLQTRPRSEETHDFLYYEDAKLVGYLNISSYGTQEKELLGMVHPEHRRRGIFRILLMAASEECMRSGVQKLILVCEHASRSGLAFAASIGAHYDFSEHAMLLEDFQESGYGRQILEAAIRTIHAEGDKRITLEVETHNTNAIGLYHSCGFQVITTYDYYAFEL